MEFVYLARALTTAIIVTRIVPQIATRLLAVIDKPVNVHMAAIMGFGEIIVKTIVVTGANRLVNDIMALVGDVNLGSVVPTVNLTA